MNIWKIEWKISTTECLRSEPVSDGNIFVGNKTLVK
jgi:hypothetical protein